MKSDTLTIPNHRLRQARLRQGWSQKEVAKRLETSVLTVYRWERGLTIPSLYYRHRLGQLFKVSSEELGLVTDPKTAEDSPSSFLAPTITHAPALVAPPLNADPFLGRAALLNACKEFLGAGGVALYGLPGIGKTALAAAVISDPEIQAQFPDDILWITLGPHPPIQSLLLECALTLGLSEEVSMAASVEELQRVLHMALHGRRVVYVIDDAWHINDALAFKIGGDTSAYVVTTRMLPLAYDFAHSHILQVDELNEQSSMELLTYLVPRISEHEELGRSLVHLVGGLPLALTLMGRYLQRHAIFGSQRRFIDALRRLQHAEERCFLEEPYAPLERPPYLASDAQRSVHAAIAVSEQALPSDARRTFHYLETFDPKPASFSEAAVLAVCGDPQQQLYENLDTLIDYGLLQSADIGFQLHPCIVDYLHTDGSDCSPTG